jgi:RNA polymerase sigma factor (sigma-70 family)
VIPLDTSDSDFLFAESCLAGEPGAAERLKALLDDGVTHVVIKAGAPPSTAHEMMQDLVAELVVGIAGRPPLLQKYSGRSPLRSWLIRVALNRWLDLWRRLQEEEEHAPDCGRLDGDTKVDPPTVHPDDEPVIKLLREAIGTAMSEVPAEDFVLFRLMNFEGLHQTELARMFGYDRRTIARQSERIADEIRGSIMAHIVARAPAFKLDWQDIVELCHAASGEVIAGN